MTGSVNLSFRNKLLAVMSDDWMTVGDIALRVNAADYAVKPALRAMWRDSKLRAMRRASDSQTLYRPKPIATPYAITK
jgi:hypothetical protein